MSGAKCPAPWRLTLHEPLVQLLLREQNSPLRDVVLRDLTLSHYLLEGLRCLLEVGRSLLEGEPLIGRNVLELVGGPRQKPPGPPGITQNGSTQHPFITKKFRTFSRHAVGRWPDSSGGRARTGGGSRDRGTRSSRRSARELIRTPAYLNLPVGSARFVRLSL